VEDPPKEEEQEEKSFFGKMMTPFTAPVKVVKKGASAAAGVVGSVLEPVGKVVGKVAAPVSSIAGTIGGATTAASLFFPPLAPIAATADAVSMGAGLAASGSKLVDGDPNTQVGLGDALPLLSMFP